MAQSNQQDIMKMRESHYSHSRYGQKGQNKYPTTGYEPPLCDNTPGLFLILSSHFLLI